MTLAVLLIVCVGSVTQWKSIGALEITFSVGVVTDGGDGVSFAWTEILQPIPDVHATVHFNWSTIDPRDPFVASRNVKDSCGLNVTILRMNWVMRSLLFTSQILSSNYVVIWFNGIVRDITGLAAEKENRVHMSNCGEAKTKHPDVLPVTAGLRSDFLVWKGQYLTALSRLMDLMDWERYMLILDESTAHHVNELLSLEQGRFVTTMEIYPETTSDQIFEGIGRVYNRSSHAAVNIVVFCEIHCALRMLKEAQQFDQKTGGVTALSHMSQWLVPALPKHKKTIETAIGNMNNIAIMVPVMEKVADVTPASLTELLHKSMLDVFVNINMSSDSSVDRDDEFINMTVNAFVSQIKMQDRSKPCPGCAVFDIYTALWKKEGRLLSKVGSFYGDQTLYVVKDRVFPNIYFGFNNQTLRVATTQWPIFVVKDKNGNYEGLCFDLLLELSRKLNFSYTAYEPESPEFGVIGEDGHWTGLVGELAFGRANLVAAPLSITVDRESVADFTYPFYHDYNVVLIKKPDDSKDKWRRLIDIFTYPVYIGIGISLPFMTLLVHLCEKHNPYYQYHLQGTPLPENGLHKFQDALWYMYGALLTQGGVFLPKSQAGRTLLSFWWLYSIIMVASYSGNLIASLTVNMKTLPFDTLEELVEQDEYMWGTTPGTYINQLFKESNISVYQRLVEGIEEFTTKIDARSSNHSVHIGMVKQGGYAYINDKSGMTEWVSAECDLAFIKEEFFPMRYAFSLPNQSPYVDMFSDQVIKIVESGLLHIWRQKWWPKKNFCGGQVKASAKRIEMTDVQSAFYVLVIGAVVGALVVLGEFLTKQFKERRGNPKPRGKESGNIYRVQMSDAIYKRKGSF